MIQLAGKPFQQYGLWPAGSMGKMILQRILDDSIVYSYPSLDELKFEVTLRKNIIESARAMNEGSAQFTTFANSRCNPNYWKKTNTGAFQLKHSVKPSDAIKDIFKNSSQYAFECATAKVMIYYDAVLKSIGEENFNQLFRGLYLYSWHADSDLGIQSTYTDHFLPGDVVYFDNPDFDPQTDWWRGENAVVLGDGTYFGHGLGIRTADQMIHALNNTRKQGSTLSASLKNIVIRPSFSHLAKFSLLARKFTAYKFQFVVIHHNENSISHDRYRYYLYVVYNQMTF
ncbi:protein-glutamine gamma-glutamyltransferase [Bacillaceae bacterium Marseille-Q3522]|nr:protein-glutamine gamma-glutamyltransferase [Bacillaceae bacterium Marseille-Q3522]